MNYTFTMSKKNKPDLKKQKPDASPPPAPIPPEKPNIYDILKNHTKIIENVEHVFYSNGQNNMLFISFAGAVKLYVAITWFYQNPQLLGNFLFLKDNPENFTTYDDEKYAKIIQHYIQKLNVEKLITYGPSMGGVASIIYGLKFKAQLIISIDPAVVNYDFSTIIEQIRGLENEYNPKIYINYTFSSMDGNYAIIPDTTQKMIEELMKKNVLITIHPYRSTEHLAFIPSKEYLIDIIGKIGNLSVSNYYGFDKWF